MGNCFKKRIREFLVRFGFYGLGKKYIILKICIYLLGRIKIVCVYIECI